MPPTSEIQPLNSADTVLRLLLLFRKGRPVRVSEAAVELDVARSSAHRMLTTLKNRGFVRQDRRTRAYLLGEVLVDLVRSTPSQKQLEDVAMPILRDLVARVRETCHVAILHGATVAYVAGVESPETLRTGLHVAMAFPAHTTAAGKCLLAFLPAGDLRKRCATENLTVTRKNAVHSWGELVSILELTRRRGYGTNFEETETGVNAVAVPIAGTPEPYGALVLTGPSSRLGRRKMEGLARQLRVTACELSSALIAAGVAPNGLG